MKKQDRKVLKESLILAVKKQLLENNAEIANKFEKAVKKSIKQIVKKARLRKTIAASEIIKTKKVLKTAKKNKQPLIK